jgi:excisionase family DNA binding protein
MKKLPNLPPDYRERLLNTREVAAGLLMQPSTVARWARQGRLPAYRLGRRLRFKWAEVEIAIAEKCRVSANKGGV